MRYYNENPQVTYLLEKIEEQEKEIKHWQGMCAQLQQELDISNETNTGLKWSREYWRDKGKNFWEKIEEFNSLPLYKKLFYCYKYK